VYSALGDKLYDNQKKINSLINICGFNIHEKKIKEYIFDLKSLKGIGFMIDNGDFEVTKKEYLQNLRKLSKTNDFFVVLAKKTFHKSIKEHDSNTFLDIIKTGLIDTDRNKDLIKEYYYEHKADIDIEGTVIEGFVKDDLKNKKKVYKGPSKEDIQRAKIERIRAKDKKKQESIQKSIEEELSRKKQQIRQDQKKELKTK
jgi:hypothetical protein